MDEFDRGGELETLSAGEAQRLGKHQHQSRSDSLAASVDDVMRDLVDQRDVGAQALAYHAIDLQHVGGHRVNSDRFWGFNQRGSALVLPLIIGSLPSTSDRIARSWRVQRDRQEYLLQSKVPSAVLVDG